MHPAQDDPSPKQGSRATDVEWIFSSDVTKVPQQLTPARLNGVHCYVARVCAFRFSSRGRAAIQNAAVAALDAVNDFLVAHTISTNPDIVEFVDIKWSLPAYIRSIAVRAAARKLRCSPRTLSFEDGDLHDLISQPNERTPDRPPPQGKLFGVVSSTLDPDQVELIARRFVLGESSGDIAKDLGCRAETVWRRLQVIFEKIRKQLPELKELL